MQETFVGKGMTSKKFCLAESLKIRQADQQIKPCIYMDMEALPICPVRSNLKKMQESTQAHDLGKRSKRFGLILEDADTRQQNEFSLNFTKCQVLCPRKLVFRSLQVAFM